MLRRVRQMINCLAWPTWPELFNKSVCHGAQLGSHFGCVEIQNVGAAFYLLFHPQPSSSNKYAAAACNRNFPFSHPCGSHCFCCEGENFFLRASDGNRKKAIRFQWQLGPCSKYISIIFERKQFLRALYNNNM